MHQKRNREWQFDIARVRRQELPQKDWFWLGNGSSKSQSLAISRRTLKLQRHCLLLSLKLRGWGPWWPLQIAEFVRFNFEALRHVAFEAATRTIIWVEWSAPACAAWNTHPVRTELSKAHEMSSCWCKRSVWCRTVLTCQEEDGLRESD